MNLRVSKALWFKKRLPSKNQAMANPPYPLKHGGAMENHPFIDDFH